MKVALAILLFLHGFITALQAKGSFTPGKGNPNPEWLAWWPVSLGQSWLFPRSSMEKTIVSNLSGTLWLIAGIVLVASAFGLLGIIIPSPWWRVLAGVGAAVSMVLLIIYAHPLFIIGIGANMAILIVLLWIRWPSAAVLGS